jgi:hypothetical protein
VITLCIEARNGKRLQTRTQKPTWLELGCEQTKCKLPSLCERRMCHSICDCSATDVYWILFGEREVMLETYGTRELWGERYKYENRGCCSMASDVCLKVYFVSRKYMNPVMSRTLWIVSVYLLVFIVYCTLWSHMCVASRFTMPQSSIDTSNFSKYAAKKHLAKQRNRSIARCVTLAKHPLTRVSAMVRASERCLCFSIINCYQFVFLTADNKG